MRHFRNGLNPMKHIKSSSLIPIILTASTLLSGCQKSEAPGASGPESSSTAVKLRAPVLAANNEFLQQKSFDPWILTTKDASGEIPAYLGNGVDATVFGRDGMPLSSIKAGNYSGGALVTQGNRQMAPVNASGYMQSLDMRTGQLTTTMGGSSKTTGATNASAIWKSGDITIVGDPEAQQVTHANVFYLASSIAAGTANSIPPMGLSSTIYGGHIFWDAEIWMLPSLLPQFSDRARSMIDYRFKRLAQAKQNAAGHHYNGAEYPWESADTGKEEAPPEFAQERHITADVAYAAWQYYLWTGDKKYLSTEGWPILQASAQYWTSRVKKGADGKYHIAKVLSPDETSGDVNDDAWTNGVVAYTLRAAALAASIAGTSADPTWVQVANGIILPFDTTGKHYLEHADCSAKLVAKQADTQMLIYPLSVQMPADVAGNTLDYCLSHTMAVGPAMTSSINATAAAMLGRREQSLDLFHDSYRPFMRSGLAAFSEKRTANRVYFCTGMGGCLQTVLYGFAGLNVAWGNQSGKGTSIAKGDGVGLFADPHLPPGWTSITLKGVRFWGTTYTITVSAQNRVVVTKGT